MVIDTRISDFIAETLRDHGVKYVFGVQGSGTIVQMFDSVAQCEGIDYVCTLHEQAAGMAADGYAHVNGTIGACLATAGPGASNLYTCVAGAYYNSIPVVFIVGQTQSYSIRKDPSLRFYGFHENCIEDMFKPVCKYVTQILDKEHAVYEIEKAVHLSTEGRPGPVVIAIPDDITWLQIEPETQTHFIPDAEKEPAENACGEFTQLLYNARRPIIIAGRGICCSGAKAEFRSLIDLLNWPVALTWGAKDLLPNDDERNVGGFGNMATRGGNFAVQNADVVLSIGARLDSAQTGNAAAFARHASVISVDVDPAELEKYRTFGIKCDYAVCCDAKRFLRDLTASLDRGRLQQIGDWLSKISEWKTKYPVCKAEYYDEAEINPYVFTDCLSELAEAGDVIVTDASTSKNYVFQSLRVKNDQNVFTWWNYCCLGYGLPAAVGAAFADRNRRTIAVMGDGALQFNIQELSTVMFHRLNMKILVFDNGGFSNIIHQQDAYLGGKRYGSDRENGLPLPDSARIAAAYGFPVVEIYRNDEMREKLDLALRMDGPVFCAIHIPIERKVVPARKGSDPLEDMTPKLSPGELYDEMIVH